MTAMILSKVALSSVWPLLLPLELVMRSPRKSVMGDSATGKATALAAVEATVLIMLPNVVLIRQMLP